MRVDWCVSSWFRIKNTHSHAIESIPKQHLFERVGGSCLFTGAGRPRARRTGSGTSGAGRRASTLRVAQKASARRRYGERASVRGERHCAWCGVHCRS